MRDGMKMIHSSEFENIPVSHQYFWVARAYLDGSRVLCKSIIDEEFSPQYSSTRVVLHLCRHAIELFLKGAIAVALGENPPTTHNLSTLMFEYDRLYPDTVYRFQIPFGVEDTTTAELFPDLLKRYHKTLDQRYRYPADQKGEAFSVNEGFIPGMFLEQLEALWKVFLNIEHKITRSTVG